MPRVYAEEAELVRSSCWRGMFHGFTDCPRNFSLSLCEKKAKKVLTRLLTV
jgi:hypothetical protein